MPIPDYQSILSPLLKLAGDKKEHSLRDAINYVSNFFNLTDKKRRELLPSGYDRIIDNRVAWSRTYLKKAGLLDYPKRGFFKITEEGLRVLKENPPKIDVKFLMRFPGFVEFQTPKKKEVIDKGIIESKQTPGELMELGNEALKESLAQELLEKLRTNSPDFFEKVVVDLLNKMGYGEGEVTGGFGDEGIDGIIYQDRLGIDKIYLQAKRYSENNIITPNMISKFVGDLDSKGATKGVFITTSSFHRDVKRIIDGTHKSIVLIDGKELVDLMIEYDIGVSTDKHFKIKKLDSDYFED